MSLSGGNVASQARFALALSIISTSAKPAGSPRPKIGHKQNYEQLSLYKIVPVIASLTLCKEGWSFTTDNLNSKI